MKNHFLLAALFLLAASVAAANESPSLPTATEIVIRMGSRDLLRQVSIEGYAGMRRYVLDNQNLHKRAEMLVQVQGDPAAKRFVAGGSAWTWTSVSALFWRYTLEWTYRATLSGLSARTGLNRCCDEL